MNNSGISSFINSYQNTPCKQQVDFEHEINENIMPTSKSSNPTESNVGNKNTVYNISKEVETSTCLQEFDKKIDNLYKNNVPINTRYEIEIDIEGVHLNDLATLSDINNSSIDNFDDWQDINYFVKNNGLNTVEHCSNNKDQNYLEIPIDNNEHSNLDNDEIFSDKTNDITGLNGQNLTNAEEIIKNVLDDLSSMKHDNTCLNSEIRISQTPGASSNKTIQTNLQTEKQIPTDSLKISTVDTQHKQAILNLKEYRGKCIRMQRQAKNKRAVINNVFNYRNKVDKIANKININQIIIISSDDEDDVIHINTQYNDTNKFEKPECKSTKCFNIHNKPALTTKKQDFEPNNNKNSTNTFEFKKHEVESIDMKYLEVPVTKGLSNTAELAGQECESNNNEYLNIHKQSTNTEEFEKQGNDSDCDGYNSSDFEFIDEEEAKKNVLNLEYLFGESYYLKATTNNGPDLEVDTTTTNFDKRPNLEVCSEINDEIGAKLPLPSIESLFAIHDNQKAINFNECCDEDNIIHDYFKTLDPTVNVNESDNSYRDSHRIPNDDELVNLFGGNFTPIPMFSFENKATNFGTGMSPDSDVGFNTSIFRDESTPALRREAKETEVKILAMYPMENRRSY